MLLTYLQMMCLVRGRGRAYVCRHITKLLSFFTFLLSFPLLGLAYLGVRDAGVRDAGEGKSYR